MTTSALGATRSTLIDVAKRLDPDGKIAGIAEVLNQACPAFQDAPYIESNAQMGNRVTLRSSLPTASWVRINQGVSATKSSTKQVVDTIGIMQMRSEVDVKMKAAVGDFNGYRATEDKAHLQAMAHTAESTIFTGNETTNDAAFTGFVPRYNDVLSTATIGSSQYQVVDGGGTGSDNESIWIVDWGENACHLIYPQGSMAGIEVEDLGDRNFVEDEDSKTFRAAITEFTLKFGLTIHNTRSVVRICNIDKSDLAGSTPPSLVRLMIQGFHKMGPQMGASRVIYCSRNVATRFEEQASGVVLGTGRAINLMDWQGVATPSFRGCPIRETDALGADEARIT